MRQCKHCGCTDLRACVDLESGTTCAWVLPDVCSFCVEQDAVADFILYHQLAHQLAEQIPMFLPAEHAQAAQLYAEACR